MRQGIREEEEEEEIDNRLVEFLFQDSGSGEVTYCTSLRIRVQIPEPTQKQADLGAHS